MSLSAGRLAAGRALLDAEQGRHLDEALERHAPRSPQELGHAWHIAFGVCRRRGELDAMIRELAKRPPEPPVLVALRVGLLERWFARTPTHAATDQAVRLCKKLGAARASGFVNAVMRRARPVEGLPASVNHPDWLVQRWTARFGEEAVQAWCARNDTPPPLSVVALGDTQALAARFVDAGLEVRPGLAGGREVPGVLELSGVSGPVRELPGFAEGQWFVMDAAAAAAVDLISARPGLRVLDACAAPGGKTLRMLSAGASVVAADRSAARLEKLRGSLDRLALEAPEIELREVDWEQAPWTPEPRFEAVLVDAPCTALGTTRRHPELRWTRAPTDPAAMAVRQARVLRGALGALRPGGCLVYSVCSPEPEEGSALVARLLERHPELRLEQELLTAPPSQDEDAHYAARLRHVEDP